MSAFFFFLCLKHSYWIVLWIFRSVTCFAQTFLWYMYFSEISNLYFLFLNSFFPFSFYFFLLKEKSIACFCFHIICHIYSTLCIFEIAFWAVGNTKNKDQCVFKMQRIFFFYDSHYDVIDECDPHFHFKCFLSSPVTSFYRENHPIHGM